MIPAVVAVLSAMVDPNGSTTTTTTTNGSGLVSSSINGNGNGDDGNDDDDVSACVSGREDSSTGKGVESSCSKSSSRTSFGRATIQLNAAYIYNCIVNVLKIEPAEYIHIYIHTYIHTYIQGIQNC